MVHGKVATILFGRSDTDKAKLEKNTMKLEWTLYLQFLFFQDRRGPFEYLFALFSKG